MQRIYVSVLFLIACFYSPISAQLPYQNESLKPDQRAEDLVKRLTIEEKAALMQNNSPAIPRLGIKAYEWWNEGLHGVGRAGLATVFPQAIGMAASFNEDLLLNVFTAVSDEARAKSYKASVQGRLRRYQGLTYWTPNVNIFRDPRWGRGQETYGEDPYLTSRLGVAVVKGLQGPDNSPYDKLHACAKHFAVHSGPEWNRHSFNAENISARDLWETYLPAFKDLVLKADVKEVMCAYNRFEDEPCCGSNRLLTQILRDQWNFKGVVVSDCGAISDFYRKGAHETQINATHASASAVMNGTDLDCGNDFRVLPDAVSQGLISEERVDVSLKRLLTARFELGEMNQTNPWPITMDVVNSSQNQALALKIAHESLVLLQNKNNILPLRSNIRIAVVGPNANDSVMQWGNYNGNPAHTVTLLEALKAKFPLAQLVYEYGCDRTSDLAISSRFQECSIGGEKGFSASYWNNRDSEGEPVVSEVIATPLRYTTMGATAFATGVNIRDFSAKYKTQFRPTKSETIVFKLQAVGQSSLLINGEPIAQRGLSGLASGYTLQAEAGKTYDLELSFSQGTADASLNFDFGPLVPVDLSATVERVKDADVVIFAGGIAPSLEGEEMRVTIPGFKGGDRTDIELPSIQRRMLAALKAAGKKVVFVNFSGSAMGLVPETQSCDAILQAWYPGQAGGTALVDALFGSYNPSGKLPITFYKSSEQLPDFEDYSMKGRTYRYMTEVPLFPFGFGLSYTRFKVGKASLSKSKIALGETLQLSIPVKNSGKRAGDETVQVYLRRKGDAQGPLKTLRAFKKVHIEAGKKVKIALSLAPDQLEWFDTSTNTVRVLRGEFELLYGNSSQLSDLKIAPVTIF